MAKRPFAAFLITIAVFFGLWILNALLRVPIADVRVGGLVAAVLFISLPVLAIYFGAALQWRPLVSLLVLVLCFVVVWLCSVAIHSVAGLQGAFVSGLLQVARIGWPMALGFLICGLVKDKNLLLPIAIVLATVDILAVLSPMGTVRLGLQNPAIRPIFDAFAFQIPKFGAVSPAAQMGPADPLFLGMFFYALHKFKMRAQATLFWIIPALALYLFIVLRFGSVRVAGISLGALPALVPIGIVIVAVNWREFSMSREEKGMTFAVALLALVLLLGAFLVWR